MQRPIVLCFASYFLPGFKSGGPVRSLTNLCEWAGGRFEFRVLTRNRDLGERRRYAGREPGRWFTEGDIGVSYVDESATTPRDIIRVVRDLRPALLYFQSFLDPVTTILPLVLRRVGLLPGSIPVVVAPRGELSPGALGLKRRKKDAWLRVARLLGIYRGVAWHATGEAEAAHIRDWAGADARVWVAGNLPRRSSPEPGAVPDKQAGALRLVFLSRVSPMKNLDGAIGMLATAGVAAELDVYGMLEDPAYWAQCEAAIARLPAAVRVHYRGVVPPAEVADVLARYDALLLPTLGENFGHVILEALLAGCPVLISDRTPWRELGARRAGFDIPLDRPEEFAAALRRLAAMDAAEHAAWRAGARRAGTSYCEQADVAAPTLAMLGALARG